MVKSSSSIAVFQFGQLDSSKTHFAILEGDLFGAEPKVLSTTRWSLPRSGPVVVSTLSTRLALVKRRSIVEASPVEVLILVPRFCGVIKVSSAIDII